MKPCQPCGSCHACVTFHGVALINANAQYHRRQLRSRSGLQHPCVAPTRALRRASRAGNSKCPKSSSTVTECPSFVTVKAASDTVPSEQTPAQMHGFAGLGAQRTLDFLAAWDQLALRLPPQAGMGKAAELILNALKLEVSHLPPQTDSLEASTAASKALAIATQLADLSGQGFPLDAESIAAGILVDAVAAQRLSLDLVDHRLGLAVATLIEDVIKVRRLPSRVDLYDDVASSALRELALTFYDTRAIVVELVARLVGMASPLGTPLYARQLAALEALQIYAPLGHGLGLRALCAQLEDRCFQELFPESYAETAAWLRREVNAHGDSLARCIQQLQAAVEQDPEFQVLAAECQVAGRTKSLFSTMKKLLRLDSIGAGGRAPQEVHDILASRCIVTPHPDLPAPQAEEFATQACYVVARVATSLFEETAARRKDYIAQPKDNGYQSLHCTIKLPPVTVECEGGGAPGDPDRGAEECVLQQGPTCELQIRTQRMHELAECGDAAHAAYKGGLDALQANKLQSWTHTLGALPPAALVDEHPPPKWSNRAAAAEQLFSHLDRDGDGYISVEELGVLLEELGVDAGVNQEQDPRQSQGPDAGAAQWAAQGAGQQMQGVDAGAGQQLLAALANKQQSGVTFAEFLQFNSQASLLGALPKVDTETAQSLRRSTSPASQASAASPATPPALPEASPSMQSSNLDSGVGSISLHAGSLRGSFSEARRHELQACPGHGIHLGQTHDDDISGRKQGPSHTFSAFTSYQPVCSIPHSSRAQFLAVPYLSEAAQLGPGSHAVGFSRPAGRSNSVTVCHCVSNGQTPIGVPLLRQWGPVQGRAAGLSAAPCSGSASHGAHMAGFGAHRSYHSSWRLHAVGSGRTTAGIDSDVAGSPQSSRDDRLSDDRRLSHSSASSSGSSMDSEDLANGSALLRTKLNESTLSLDLSDLPESSTPLPKPHATTSQPDQSSDQANDVAALLSPSHNESTISLDLDDLPKPPELMRPPRPRIPPPSTSQEQRVSPRASQSLDWDDLSPQKSSSSKSGNRAQSQRQTLAGSWDNFQPLFRPASRVEPPKEPQQPPNESAAADMMFSAIQSKRYKHEKGTSYKDATFALVPVDRKVGWRLQCDDEVTVAQPIHLPQHGPLLLGGGDPRQGNCDLVLESAVEVGPGVNARLEIYFNGRKPCCLVTCLKPYGTTFVNKVKLPRMVDTEVYLGDILSFGELTMAFQLVPVLVPDRQQSALDNAVHYAKAHATKQRVPKKYEVVADFVRQMSRGMQFSQARALMTSHLVKDPVNSEGWAQLANMERRMASNSMKDASIPAARCFYRAAAELIQIKLKANASPNGEAKRGSQQHVQLMRAVTSFIRVMSSWAQMEFDLRNDTSARRLYRRALDAVPKDPPLQGLELTQPVKLLFKWAHQEFKGDNLFQARELLQGLLQLEPSSTRGLGMLGTLEWKAGKRQLARQYLMAGIKADPSHVANLHTLARLELEEGHLEEARKLFARGQQLEPNNVYILQSWALAEAAEGDTELARGMLQKATLVQPRSVPCWHAWAMLEMTNGNTDKARELYLKALELDPRETFTQSALGALERKCGNYDEALAYLNRALELTPRHPAACVEKAIVLRKQGKVALADAFTETALKEKTAVVYKRGTREKHANEFVRSSEAEQEERRQRQQKEAQGQARKTAATQKGKKAHINRMRRKRKQHQKQEAKALQEAAAAAQAEGPVERVVNTEMQ
ncbi:hypothetical protein WJX77_011849 [Trebouxia sp. C0004]